MAGTPRRPISLPDTGFLAGMRIRKKLIVLHTFFSLILVALLTLALKQPLAVGKGHQLSGGAQWGQDAGGDGVHSVNPS